METFGAPDCCWDISSLFPQTGDWAAVEIGNMVHFPPLWCQAMRTPLEKENNECYRMTANFTVRTSNMLNTRTIAGFRPPYDRKDKF